MQNSNKTPGVSRRQLLIGGASLLGSFTFAGPTLAWAKDFEDTPLHQRFMRLSQLLVNHRLNEGVGLRIAAFAAQKHADLSGMIGQIVEIAEQRDATEVEQFFDAIPEGELRDLAYWVIAAWYSGASSAAADAEPFTYEHALTYQTTLDIVPIPSFGLSGPNGWSRPPAPLMPVPRF
ncbi:sorbitol dehydrogenase family protein [Salinicola avicenniae]|uniref:sorbitol dehydrogenase family protein n=1 Tax=Salinicola avicenniae TaxID=2916836 RepID=UPI0020741E79|nr:sorbitol dehydrogenase family protein [Salinicola sp. S1-1-8]